jgi:phospholipase/carboxylesterase
MATILGLHGSSGHPAVIRSVIDALDLQADILCPEGGFADGPGFTFFRRNPDFSIPVDTVLELARQSLAPGGFACLAGSGPLALFGYSSGAVFATAQLAVAPQRIAGAILLRPQVLAEDFAFPALNGMPVLLLSGRSDPRRKPHHAALLGTQLDAAGARLTHHALDTGHEIGPQDVKLSRAWIAGHLPEWRPQP